MTWNHLVVSTLYSTDTQVQSHPISGRFVQVVVQKKLSVDDNMSIPVQQGLKVREGQQAKRSSLSLLDFAGFASKYYC